MRSVVSHNQYGQTRGVLHSGQTDKGTVHLASSITRLCLLRHIACSALNRSIVALMLSIIFII